MYRHWLSALITLQTNIALRKSKEDIIDQLWESPNISKYLKYAGVVVGTLAGIYILGHVFKIGAHTIRGFNDLKNSLKGN